MFEFLQAASSSTDTDTYTFSSQNLGTAAADRYIFVGVTSRSSGTTNTINSVTVGGVTATQVELQRTVTTVVNMAGLYIAAVPTGTTGDVVVTFNATTLRCGIGMWGATGLASATATDSDVSSANAPTYAIDVVAGGFAIGVAYGADNNAPGATTWTGITEDYDGVSEGTNVNTGASDTFETTQTNLTITATFSDPDSGVSAGVFASWEIGGAEEGPANLAKFSTVTKANIAQINTTDLANISQVNVVV